jgi:hypothetical protein
MSASAREIASGLSAEERKVLTLMQIAVGATITGCKGKDRLERQGLIFYDDIDETLGLTDLGREVVSILKEKEDV